MKTITRKVAFEKAKPADLAAGGGAKPFWYLNRKGDLGAVTAEESNESLGIRKINVIPVTEVQEKAGMLCKVRLNTYAATIENISIYESDHTPGDIYLKVGGRKVGTESHPKWQHDVKLTSQAKAQILSYVYSLLEEK